MEPDVSEFSVRPARTQPRAFSISSIYSKKTAIADSWGRVQHMNHGPAFHAYMRHLQKEVEVLRGQGHFGEGPVPPLSDLPFVGYLTGIGDLSFLLFDALLDGNLQGSIRLASGWGVERRTWRTRSSGRILPSTSYVYSFPPSSLSPRSWQDLTSSIFSLMCSAAVPNADPALGRASVDGRACRSPLTRTGTARVRRGSRDGRRRGSARLEGGTSRFLRGWRRRARRGGG